MSNNGHRKPQVDVLPPHDIEAEKALLSCVMISPDQVMPSCIARLGVKGEQFYDLKNRTIYEAMVVIYDAKKPIDVILVCDQLKKMGELEGVGIAYVSDVRDACPTSALEEHYLEIVFEKWLMRRMIVACTDAVGRIQNYRGEVGNIIDVTEKSIFEVGNASTKKETPPVKQLVQSALDSIASYSERKGVPRGIASGFPDLDYFTGGFLNSDMYVLAGRPSTGKTSLAMNIAEHIAVDNDIPVGIFSLEMKAQALTERMIYSRAKVNGKNVERGYITDQMRSHIFNSAARIANAPIHIDDTKGMSIFQLRAKARRMKQRHDIKLMVVDYLQLLNAMGSKKVYEGRQQEVSEISSGIKNLADELDMPVIVLSQLNRLLDREKDRRPRLSDLRESGAIEQDADWVGMLYRAGKADDEEAAYKEVIPVALHIAKHRNGEIGDAEFTFFKPFTRFESLVRTVDPDQDAQQTMNYRNPHANA